MGAMWTLAWLQLQRIGSRVSRQEGQGMVEYGLVVALIAVVVVGAVALFGDNLRAMIDNLAAWVADNDPGTP